MQRKGDMDKGKNWNCCSLDKWEPFLTLQNRDVKATASWLPQSQATDYSLIFPFTPGASIVCPQLAARWIARITNLELDYVFLNFWFLELTDR